MPADGDEVVVSYKQGCFGLGAYFVGLSGGVALAYLTEVHNTKPLFTISSIPQLEDYIKKIPQASQFIGGKPNPVIRLGLQGLGCAFIYSYLECKFQRGHRRTILDSGLTGAITGGAYGLRGIPGGAMGAGCGAGGFALYAALMHIIFR